MRPTTAFIIFVMTLLLFLCSLYYVFLFHFELEALNQAEIVSSAELTLAHYKHTVAAILMCVLIFATLWALGHWIHCIVEN